MTSFARSLTKHLATTGTRRSGAGRTGPSRVHALVGSSGGLLAPPRGRILSSAHSSRSSSSSSNITYSGGQATAGQGGYYGSGGARATGDLHAASETDAERAKVLALAADVETIHKVMEELSTLESLLESEEGSSNGSGTNKAVSNKSIEIRNAIKKLMTAPEVTAALNRLHVQGEPVWGLSVSERDMIAFAREKVKEC